MNKEIELSEENDGQEVEETIKIDDKKEKYAQDPILDHDHSHDNDKKDGAGHCKEY